MTFIELQNKLNKIPRTIENLDEIKQIVKRFINDPTTKPEDIHKVYLMTQKIRTTE